MQPAEEGDNIHARERWFYQRRSSPLGFIPGAARLSALQELETIRTKERARAAAGAVGSKSHALSSTVWTPIGPRPTSTAGQVGNVSGRIAALAVNPLNRDEVYVGGAQGGVWRSVDGGANWTPLLDGDPATNEPSLAIGSIAIDGTTCSPTSTPVCQTIYVGTGEQTFSGSSYFGAGILKTTDGGANWIHLGNPPGSPFVGPFSIVVGGARIGSLAIRPGTSGPTTELLAGVQILINPDNGDASGVYRSTDAGATWTLVPSASGASGNEVLFDPADASGNVAYAALGVPSRPGPVGDPQAGIYKSTDGGATFTKLFLPSPVITTPGIENVGRVEISIGQGVLYASIANATTGSDSLLGVFRSTNGGANWTHLSTAPNHCNPQCWYDHVIQVHPANGNVVYIGGSAAPGQYFSRTIDGGGATGTGIWQGAICSGIPTNCLHVDIQSMAIGVSGGAATLYVGNDGGVWKADVTNPTAGLPLGWVNLNAGLELTQFYPSPSIHPTDIHLGFGGTQDNNTQRYTGSLTWTSVTCGDGGWTIIDPVNPNNVYVTCQNIDIRKSTNGGVSNFNSAVTGITTSDDVSFIPPFVMDPNNPARLYFGTCRVWQTINNAGSWTAISPDLSEAASGASCTANFGTIETIAVAPSNSNIVYAGTSDGVIQRTTNALAGPSAIWTDITGNLSTVRGISWIAVHPTDPDTVYVGLSGFTGASFALPDTTRQVFRTTTVNGAATVWTDISSNLPNIPINTVLIDPQDTNTVYLATDVGIFFADDAGPPNNTPTWTTLMTGLPRVAVMGLALHNATRTLRAATHGRGMWDLNLNPAKKRRGQIITTGPSDPRL
jgi:hypothetical protein